MTYRYKRCATKSPKKNLTTKKKKIISTVHGRVAKGIKTTDSRRRDKEEDQYVSNELGSYDLSAFEDKKLPKL